MSFVYPRVISLSRSNVPIDTGTANEYSGVRPDKEMLVAENVPASIQLLNPKSKPVTNLPADTSGRTYWRVLIPLGALALGAVETHDIVTDELGARYDVIGPYFNSLGYALLVERLEV
jgi:hypothetical protein